MYDEMIGRFLSQDPIGFTSGDANMYRYAGNDPSNKSDPSGLWQENGHFYTVYIIMRLAGRKANEAFEMAYWAQYPDENALYDAVDVALTRNKAYKADKPRTVEEYRSIMTAKRDSSRFPVLFKLKYLAILKELGREVEYDQLIQEVLHSLHGGDQVARREALTEQLVTFPNLKPWQTGFILHALGDSYAHTKPLRKFRLPLPKASVRFPGLLPTIRLTPRSLLQEEAYDYPIGHLLDLTYPDHIRLHFSAYERYVHNLARVFGPQDGDRGYKAFYADVNRLLNRMKPTDIDQPYHRLKPEPDPNLPDIVPTSNEVRRINEDGVEEVYTRNREFELLRTFPLDSKGSTYLKESTSLLGNVYSPEDTTNEGRQTLRQFGKPTQDEVVEFLTTLKERIEE